MRADEIYYVYNDQRPQDQHVCGAPFEARGAMKVFHAALVSRLP